MDFFNGSFLFVAGIQMIMLGIVEEYLWRNMDESRKRPVFIIEEKVGLAMTKLNCPS